MLERELKHIAMLMASQLPDDLSAARRVHNFLGQLIERWLFAPTEEATVQPLLRICSDSTDSKKAAKGPGNADNSPR